MLTPASGGPQRSFDGCILAALEAAALSKRLQPMFARKVIKPQTNAATNATGDLAQQRSRRAYRSSPLIEQNSSRIAQNFPAAGVIQTKLAVNEVGDSYEQDADRMAEQVMRTPEPQLRRAWPRGGGSPTGHTAQPDRDHESVQTKHVQASDAGQAAAPPIVHEVLRSPGQPLDPA